MLERLEVVERLATGAADPEALAGGRAEAAGLPGVETAALRAAHREREPDRAAGARTDRSGWRDAGLGELGPTGLGDVVGGPRRAEHELDVDVLEARAGESLDQVVADGLHRRTPG